MNQIGSRGEAMHLTSNLRRTDRQKDGKTDAQINHHRVPAKWGGGALMIK